MTLSPTARIAGIFRYPVKGLSPEPLDRAALTPGETLLADRRYAIENGPSGFDPAEPKWLSKPHFLMLQRDQWLAPLRTYFDDASHALTIRRDGAVVAKGDQVLTPKPTITGTPKVDVQLTAVPGTWDAGTTLTYQWSASSGTFSDKAAKSPSFTCTVVFIPFSSEPARTLSELLTRPTLPSPRRVTYACGT